MKQDDWTESDAAIVKGMLERGDEQHNIAAWFGVNHGRISEMKDSKKWAKKFKDVESANAENLPPPGPYTSGRNISDAIKILTELESTTTDTSILEAISNLQTLIVQDNVSTKNNLMRVKKNRKKNKKMAATRKIKDALTQKINNDPDIQAYADLQKKQNE